MWSGCPALRWFYLHVFFKINFKFPIFHSQCCSTMWAKIKKNPFKGLTKNLRIWCWKTQMCNLEIVEGWKFLTLWVNVWEHKLNLKFTFCIKIELCDQAAQLSGDFTFMVLLLIKVIWKFFHSQCCSSTWAKMTWPFPHAPASWVPSMDQEMAKMLPVLGFSRA